MATETIRFIRDGHVLSRFSPFLLAASSRSIQLHFFQILSPFLFALDAADTGSRVNSRTQISHPASRRINWCQFPGEHPLNLLFYPLPTEHPGCHPLYATVQSQVHSVWAVQWSWFARVNALCNLSRKKSREVAASLPGRFLSRHCFTLCITMEVEPRIAKQYKCHHCCSCKKYQGKGMEGGKKCLCVVFWLTRRSRVHGKNAFWSIL